MKTKIVYFQENYHLVLNSGKSKLLSISEVRDFLKNYDSFDINDVANFSCNDVSDGMVIADVEENGELHIYSPELLRRVFLGDICTYLTTEEYAKKHGRKQSIVLRLCKQGRLAGIIQKGSVWLIPEDSPYPPDARFGTRVQVVEQPKLK